MTTVTAPSVRLEKPVGVKNTAFVSSNLGIVERRNIFRASSQSMGLLLSHSYQDRVSRLSDCGAWESELRR